MESTPGVMPLVLPNDAVADVPDSGEFAGAWAMLHAASRLKNNVELVTTEEVRLHAEQVLRVTEVGREPGVDL